jgi:hypothetical protein
MARVRVQDGSGTQHQRTQLRLFFSDARSAEDFLVTVFLFPSLRPPYIVLGNTTAPPLELTLPCAFRLPPHALHLASKDLPVPIFPTGRAGQAGKEGGLGRPRPIYVGLQGLRGL